MTQPKLDKLTMELRRGLLVLAVLEALARPHHGYSLRRFLSEQGLAVDEGTLYPLLRRLESQELLVSDWQKQQGRKRRIYQLSDEGAAAKGTLTDEWQALDSALQRIVEATP